MTTRPSDIKPAETGNKRPNLDQNGRLPPGSSLDQKQQHAAKSTERAKSGAPKPK